VDGVSDNHAAEYDATQAAGCVASPSVTVNDCDAGAG
jgi:hypothetical protein